ncbi:MAG: hypothetical protein R2939_10705 [Kofleriaceae bacterium]
MRVQSPDDVFRDRELPIGLVPPGETRTFTARVKLPADAAARMAYLGAEVREARDAHRPR